MATRVFVDANVLFSRTLRDWLFLLRNASGGRMFTVGASEDVLAETVARYRDAHPTMSGGHITALRAHLDAQLDEVVAEYEVAPWMLVEDGGDGHVRAAAAAGQFDMLLTADRGLLGDADRAVPAPYEPVSPDDFLMLVHDSSRELVDDVVGEQLEYFMRRDGEVDLPRQIAAAGCPGFADALGALLRQRM